MLIDHIKNKGIYKIVSSNQVFQENFNFGNVLV